MKGTPHKRAVFHDDGARAIARREFADSSNRVKRSLKNISQ
ncbi:hypothetical protein [Sphaerothrix gracilis]